ncbi:hypothetical protein GCM10026983_27080 [Gracilibacillus alcaliphilus]
MTFEEMLNWTKRFKEIMACNDIAIKKARLKVMQVDLENTYNIPMTNGLQFRKDQPQLMALYITVVEAVEEGNYVEKLS